MRNPKAVARARRTLGSNIKQLRFGLGLTQGAAAERAGLHWRHFQKIEAAEVNVTLVSIVGLAAALETTIPALFTEKKAAS